MNPSGNQHSSLLILPSNPIFQDSTHALYKVKALKHWITIFSDPGCGITMYCHWSWRRVRGFIILLLYFNRLLQRSSHNLQNRLWMIMPSCFRINFISRKRVQPWDPVLHLTILLIGLWEDIFVCSSLNFYLYKIIWWGRYIDHILLLWSGSEAQPLQFNSYLNNTNNNLKLSLHFS